MDEESREKWGVARIELATSRTRSENHTTRPNTQVDVRSPQPLQSFQSFPFVEPLTSLLPPLLLFSSLSLSSFSRTPTRAFTPTASLSQLQEEQGEDQDIDYEIEESEAELIYEEAENVGSDERKSFDRWEGGRVTDFDGEGKERVGVLCTQFGEEVDLSNSGQEWCY
ncbi:hypothetical protein Patl1_36534 [Pistacia atlantica]|nr:hypothetical protein Patl1_36534 [Pistacia atlantica]